MRVLPVALAAAAALSACRVAGRGEPAVHEARPALPTGQTLDPVGAVTAVGQMPLAMVASPDGRRLVLLLNGYRDEGLQVVDRQGRITQTVPQPAAFLGLAFAPDGRTLWASGGNQDVVYRYRWDADTAVLADSIVLTTHRPDSGGVRYPAGLATSPDGARLYVAENLADSLAVFDVATGRLVQLVATGRYPYGVAVGPDGSVYVSNWGANTVSVFRPDADGNLLAGAWIAAGRHPSALLLNATGTRLFVASGSTDRVSVADTRSGQVVATLADPPPAGADEGTTPNALALSADGTRLFAAEADANAVAVFELSAGTSDVTAAPGDDRLSGRVPTAWYPTSLAVVGDTLLVAAGKGVGTAPNPRLPQPGRPRPRTGPAAGEAGRQYTLGQLDGALQIVALDRVARGDLPALSARVARANGWNRAEPGPARYPPFEHVVYIVRENRTYDQVLGDLAGADGDTSLVFFPRAVTPNAHALAERFGVFDRFFVNAEVSADGHQWSMAAQATDYTEKTAPLQYSGRGRTYDYEGLNRGVPASDDAAAPAHGYLWDLAQRAGISLRNFGEFTRAEDDGRGGRRYVANKAVLSANTNPRYATFDMHISDQRRVDVWLDELGQWEQRAWMPALQILHLPRDHTAGGSAGYETPKAMAADNDLALGRIVQALSASRFWRSSVIFVLEDDAQNGPDHVDSHRSVLLVLSPWSRPGVYHRFTNTTDVVRTIEEILNLDRLSQFDQYARPLRDVWADTPDLTPFTALHPAQPLDEMNPARGRAARESRRLDLRRADAGDMELMNRILWRAIKGDSAPYPGARRMSALEVLRSR